MKQKRDNEWNVFRYSMFPWWNPLNWFHNMKQWFSNLRLAIERAKYGYCDSDVWNLNEYHVYLLSEMLNDLAADPRGFPSMLMPDDQPAQWMSEEEEERYTQQWKDILRQMAEYFTNVRNYERCKPNLYDDRLFQKLDETKEVQERPDGSTVYTHKEDDELRQLRDDWMRQRVAMMEWREEQYAKAMDMMKQWHNNLYD